MKRSSLAGLLALLLTACAPTVGNTPTPPPASPPTTPATAPTAEPSLPFSETPMAISEPSPTAGQSGVKPTAPAVVPTAAPVAPDDEIAAIDAVRRRLRDQVELARALGSCRSDPAACPSVARTTPLDVQVGEVRDFYITDFDTNSQYTIAAELRYAGPVVLMYVERGHSFNQADLEQAAQAFEQEIYPHTREIFGEEMQPGVDGDNRITILTTRGLNGGVLGYFSTQDSLPTAVNRYSNEREMFVMNGGALSFADLDYLDVLAHEFQHMIHGNEQPGAEIWINEGSSQLAEDLNGFFKSGFTPFYLYNPDVQLTAWGDGPGESGAHYGASHLFMRYIYAQYAGEEQLRPLIRADAGENLQAFVDLAAQTRPDISSFGQIVADWAVANLIDDVSVADGRYGYDTGHNLPRLLPVRVEPTWAMRSMGGEVAQFGADYLALPDGTSSIEFRGNASIGIAAELPRDGYAWWSGRSDDSVATLTRPLDLRGLTAATLEFEAWFEIENDYDYAFVSISSDGGATWETLPGSLTTEEDPQGVNYGHGITGVSGAPGATVSDGVRGRWVSERMDLTPYAGQEVLLRFWSINDQGFNAPGILIDNIAVPELGLRDDVEAGAGDWVADGFVRVDGDLPQHWELRLVRNGPGGALSVEPLPTDESGRATASLAPGERGVLVVVAATPHTTERATYEIELQ